jgi:hypothetical protein
MLATPISVLQVADLKAPLSVFFKLFTQADGGISCTVYLKTRDGSIETRV